MKNLLRNTLPWFFCLLIFYYIFTKIPPRQIIEALPFLNAWLFVFYALVYFFLMHVLDCYTVKHFISRFAAPITHAESWLVRGVSYLIMILNYHAAQGAFAMYFKKTHNAPFSKTLGTLAFISLMDFVLVITSALIAIGLAPASQENPQVFNVILRAAPIFYLGFFAWIVFWKNCERPFFNKFKKLKPVHWILHHDVFMIFRDATLRDYFYLFLLRAPIVVMVVGSYHFAIKAFGAHLAWGSLFTYNPIIMVVSTLPLTPSGLGTSQLLTIEFFKNALTGPALTQGLITPASLLLSSNLLWFFANLVIKAIFGAVCLTKTSRSLFK